MYVCFSLIFAQEERSMKKLTDKFFNGIAKMSVPLCILGGIAGTILFFEKLYNYALHLYQSNVVLIPSIVGMVIFYGLAIPVVRKRQYYKHFKKEEKSGKEDD